MAEDRTRSISVIGQVSKDLGQVGLVLIAVAYGTGFLVTTVHLASYGTAPIELLRTRYLVVGSVFCLFTVLLVAPAWYVRQRWPEMAEVFEETELFTGQAPREQASFLAKRAFRVLRVLAGTVLLLLANPLLFLTLVAIAVPSGRANATEVGALADILSTMQSAVLQYTTLLRRTIIPMFVGIYLGIALLDAWEASKGGEEKGSRIRIGLFAGSLSSSFSPRAIASTLFRYALAVGSLLIFFVSMIVGSHWLIGLLASASQGLMANYPAVIAGLQDILSLNIGFTLLVAGLIWTAHTGFIADLRKVGSKASPGNDTVRATGLLRRFGAVGSAYSMVLIAVLFGALLLSYVWWIFPHLPYHIGGGQLCRARATLVDEASIELGQNLDVYVLDQSAEWFFFLDADGPTDRRVIQVRADLVASLVYLSPGFEEVPSSSSGPP